MYFRVIIFKVVAAHQTWLSYLQNQHELLQLHVLIAKQGRNNIRLPDRSVLCSACSRVTEFPSGNASGIVSDALHMGNNFYLLKLPVIFLMGLFYLLLFSMPEWNTERLTAKKGIITVTIIAFKFVSSLNLHWKYWNLITKGLRFDLSRKVMGYQLAETDREKADPKHLCTKCNSVLKEPVQTTCGHRYCRECINCILRYHLFT